MNLLKFLCYWFLTLLHCFGEDTLYAFICFILLRLILWTTHGLSWRIFPEHLRRALIWPLFGIMFYMCLSGLVSFKGSSRFYILVCLLLSCCIHYESRALDFPAILVELSWLWAGGLSSSPHGPLRRTLARPPDVADGCPQSKGSQRARQKPWCCVSWTIMQFFLRIFWNSVTRHIYVYDYYIFFMNRSCCECIMSSLRVVTILVLKAALSDISSLCSSLW